MLCALRFLPPLLITFYFFTYRGKTSRVVLGTSAFKEVRKEAKKERKGRREGKKGKDERKRKNGKERKGEKRTALSITACTEKQRRERRGRGKDLRAPHHTRGTAGLGAAARPRPRRAMWRGGSSPALPRALGLPLRIAIVRPPAPCQGTVGLPSPYPGSALPQRPGRTSPSPGPALPQPGRRGSRGQPGHFFSQ